MAGRGSNVVRLNADVFFGCLMHAYSTEREEVMGLLIGEVADASGSAVEGLPEEQVVEISNLIILSRVDKRKDRCEISSEQLVAATMQAERLATETGRPLRVVGWYHSHPHITVWPSHVDLKTQAQWQLMDTTFIGLIFSCFNDTANHVYRTEMTAFRTAPSGERDEIPIMVVAENEHKRSTLEALSVIPQIFFKEEDELFRRAQAANQGEPLISVHNCAVFTAAVCRLLDQVCAPLVNSLHARLFRNQRLIENLKMEIAEARREAKAAEQTNPFLNTGASREQKIGEDPQSYPLASNGSPLSVVMASSGSPTHAPTGDDDPTLSPDYGQDTQSQEY